MALERLSQITESGIKTGITISNASVTGVLTVVNELKVGTGLTITSTSGGATLATNSSESVRILTTGELLVGTTVGVGSTTQNIQVGQQILAPLGIISNNGYWSGVPGRLVSLNRAGDGINNHTVVLTINDIIGGPGSNGSASFMVWFSMRRGNTTSSYAQKSQYMGLWHVTRQSTNLIHVTRHDIVTGQLTIDSLVGAGADTDTTTLTLTFDTINVRSSTDYAVHFCAAGSPYPGATA